MGSSNLTGMIPSNACVGCGSPPHFATLANHGCTWRVLFFFDDNFRDGRRNNLISKHGFCCALPPTILYCWCSIITSCRCFETSPRNSKSLQNTVPRHTCTVCNYPYCCYYPLLQRHHLHLGTKSKRGQIPHGLSHHRQAEHFSLVRCSYQEPSCPQHYKPLKLVILFLAVHISITRQFSMLHVCKYFCACLCSSL